MMPAPRTILALWLLCAGPALADELRFDTEWQTWSLPQGAVEVSATGSVRPVAARKNANAVLNAVAFGGGVRTGSNRAEAALIIDGDPATGWGPDPGDLAETGWIEIDLGRVVSAHQVRLVFAGDAPPFEIFDLLLSTGEQALDEARTNVEGSLVYRIKERYRENDRQVVVFEPDEPRRGLYQYVRIQVLRTSPAARLVEVEVIALGDNLTLGFLERGGSIDITIGENTEAQPLSNALALVDGRMSTFWRTFTADRGTDDIIARIVLDLGAVYRVDLVRIIGLVAYGEFLVRRFGPRQVFFFFNFYEVLTSDGSLSPDGTLRWEKHHSGWPSTTNRLEGVVDHPFPLRPVRYVQLRWKFWDATCGDNNGNTETARGCGAGGFSEELMVFGEGFPLRADLRSPILDLDGRKNVNALHWRGQAPPGTRLELRTRTGDELRETYTFHDRNGKVVTEKKYNRLIPSFRGRVDTAFAPGGGWSPWSRIYQDSGADFLSPSLRRYAQIDARLISEDGQTAASLDQLRLEFTEPLAARVVGEIYPMEAVPGVEQTFSYFVKAAAVETGFDEVEIEASVPLRFTSALIDDTPVDVESENLDAGFRARFPRPVRAGELVELRFMSTVFVNGTRFDAFLRHSGLGIRQGVDSGDANELVESSSGVVGLPRGEDLITNLTLEPRALTPNGDGVNDELAIELDLVDVLVERPLRLEIFDLVGRLVWTTSAQVVAGQHRFSWDGRDAQGAPVPPGHFLLRLQLLGDARSQTLTRLLSIAY